MSDKNTNISFNFGGIGFALAAALSYIKWSGFWLAVGHGFLSWVYVFYYVLRYTPFGQHLLGH